jgi:hypothetical protein
MDNLCSGELLFGELVLYGNESDLIIILYAIIDMLIRKKLIGFNDSFPV